MILELHVEGAMGLCVACEDHHTAGDLIESMNNPYFADIILQASSQDTARPFPSHPAGREGRRVC